MPSDQISVELLGKGPANIASLDAEPPPLTLDDVGDASPQTPSMHAATPSCAI